MIDETPIFIAFVVLLALAVVGAITVIQSIIKVL
jgi:hypothetical protein